ncbi:MAG: hypothetical protein PHC70_00535 [Patescibacteria group bacterium]|nr:hypothetical protein [Patescibacteria group bacterium]
MTEGLLPSQVDPAEICKAYQMLIKDKDEELAKLRSENAGLKDELEKTKVLEGLRRRLRFPVILAFLGVVIVLSIAYYPALSALFR